MWVQYSNHYVYIYIYIYIYIYVCVCVCVVSIAGIATYSFQVCQCQYRILVVSSTLSDVIASMSTWSGIGLHQNEAQSGQSKELLVNVNNIL